MGWRVIDPGDSVLLGGLIGFSEGLNFSISLLLARRWVYSIF